MFYYVKQNALYRTQLFSKLRRLQYNKILIFCRQILKKDIRLFYILYFFLFKTTHTRNQKSFLRSSIQKVGAIFSHNVKNYF